MHTRARLAPWRLTEQKDEFQRFWVRAKVIVESTGNRHNDAVEETDGIVRFLEVMLEDPSIQVVLGDRHYNKENWAVWTA